MTTLTGVIEYVDLEGGLWAIRCNDGRRLVLDDLPQELRVDGLKVELVGQEIASIGISMMGNTFCVERGRRL